jgi:putative transposase
LAQPAVHATLKGVWQEARAWLVGYYLLMPDHMHFFCAPGDPGVPFKRWVAYWKRLFTQKAGNPDWAWQSGQWDTRLRRGEKYTEKWQYVAMNPVRKRLVAKSQDWPYQGVLNVLMW